MLERVAYLNAGTFGPLPRRTTDAMAERQRRNLAEGRSGAPYFEDVMEARARLRARLAALIGADESTIALATSTTEGCNAVVAGLRLRRGDEVVTTDVEHPGLLGALRAWALDVKVARVREEPASRALDVLRAAISPRTRLIALSHVAWTTGAVLPVRELAGSAIPVLVDGAQAAGAIAVDVEALGCDFYTVSGQKWLLGPDATGGLYVHRDRIEELEVSFPSYLSWEDARALEPWPDARRFESAFTPAASVDGLLAALDFADEVGEGRFERARGMAERCRSLVADRAEVLTEPGQATLVSFRTRGPAEDIVRRLAERRVVVRDLPGLGWVRASCGFWTSEDDLERLVDAL
ncbi:MAG: aminotransferase class V-fold PLP-dependent enzyme [Actinomycetota bacterium]|nr:aminotransferase class V-fold PLP-dependent enzyme [Actinomycetota bacterium]